MASGTVFVLGHAGMLGVVVTARLRAEGFDVLTTAKRFASGDPHALIPEVLGGVCDTIVNCIGTTPSRASSTGDLFAANTLLPQHLAAAMAPGQLLVHASSDGVFNGDRGGYRVADPPDALDPYGLSKRMGETAVHLGRVVVLRCSILGIDPGTPRSLLSWFLGQHDKVTGFTDHIWNGISCLEWAELAVRAARRDLALPPGIHHPGCTEPLNKFELLQAASRVFGSEIQIEPKRSGRPVDRSLVPTIDCGPIQEQLERMRRWYQSRRATTASLGD
jgi:dTDP-4-dehydrorhamnose reductase